MEAVAGAFDEETLLLNNNKSNTLKPLLNNRPTEGRILRLTINRITLIVTSCTSATLALELIATLVILKIFEVTGKMLIAQT